MSVVKNAGRKVGGDRAKVSGSRWDWHKRYHGDALKGMSAMSLEQRGAYCALIDLQYERRGPLPDDDAWLARQLNCSARKWRVIRDDLVAMGRIIHDEEAGTIFDERCMRELVDADRMRTQLVEGGRKGGQSKSKRRAKKGPDNLVVLNNSASVQRREVGVVNVTPQSKCELTDAEQEDSGQENQGILESLATKEPPEKPKQIEKEREDSSERSSAAPARRSPLNRGGAPPTASDELSPEERQAWLDEQRRKLTDAAAEDFTPENEARANARIGAAS